MDWFRLLKVQTQTQRQGFRLDDKDEDYVLEDESDCYDEFVRIYEKTKNSFPNAEKTQMGLRLPGRGDLSHIFYYGEFAIFLESEIPKKGEIPDEVFCEVIKLYKGIEDSSSGMVFKNYYIEALKKDDTHYIIIWKGEYARGEADALIILADYFVSKSGGFITNNEGHLNQNIDGWRGSFI